MSKYCFTIYSNDSCPYCTKIENILYHAKLNHIIYKLDKDFTREQFYIMFGKETTFPRVLLDKSALKLFSSGYNIGGCADTVQYLKKYKLI